MINTDRLCPGCMNDTDGEKICSICGYDSSTRNAPEHLPVRMTLSGRFFIGKSLCANGEGITYIGWDNLEEITVSVREYFPVGAAVRNPDKTTGIVAGKEYAFNEGLMTFLEINRKLASLSLPALPETVSVFEENGTAYAVTKRASCIELRDFIVRNGGSLKWEQVKPLFLPLIDTVATLNQNGIIHGAISPETILVGRDGRLRLSDIAIPSVRRTNSELEPQLYPGFAAAEQYGFENLEIGAHTDVYGMCATLFRVLIGTAPTPANMRISNDDMSIPAKFAEELPRQVLVSVANGLQVLPSHRTADMEQLKADLSQTVVQPRTAQTSHEEKRPRKPAKEKSGSAKYALISALVTAFVFLALAAVLSTTVFRDAFFPNKNANSSDDSMFTPAPSVEPIGTVDSGAVESAKLYSVPDFSGTYYAQLIDNEEYEMFQITIKDVKQFSTKYSKGQVCAQSVAVGTEVERNTVIELTVSLGSSEIKIARVTGLDETAAKLELLKQGFLYENIEVVEKYDSSSNPGIILSQEPEAGTAVNTEIPIRIYINTYEGDEDENGLSGSSSSGRTSGSSSSNRTSGSNR